MASDRKRLATLPALGGGCRSLSCGAFSFPSKVSEYLAINKRHLARLINGQYRKSSGLPRSVAAIDVCDWLPLGIPNDKATRNILCEPR